MSDYTVTLIDSIREFAEEVEATGMGTDALRKAAAQYNDAREELVSLDPDNPIWKRVPSVDLDVVSTSEISLYCAQLLRIATQRVEEQENEINVWHIHRNTRLQGSFRGIVIVHPGCEFRLQGEVIGTIVLLGESRLLWQGRLKGKVEQSPESDTEYRGEITAKIVTVSNLEEKYKEYLVDESL